MQRRGLVSTSALALAADLVSKIGVLVLTIVAARALSIDEFAVWATAIAAAGLMAVALDAGAQMLLTRDGASAPARVRALLPALALARLPLAVALIAGAAAVGAYGGHGLAGLAAGLIAVTGAAILSLSGVVRSVLDLWSEAWTRLAQALLTMGAVLGVLALTRRADAALLAVATVNLLCLGPLFGRARRVGHGAETTRVRPWLALRSALPLGLMAIGTLAFYRSGTLALAWFSTGRETATFAVASGLAFGLLAIPNAVTTVLLPRLSRDTRGSDRVHIARRALVWTAAVSIPLFLAAAVVGPTLVRAVFGDRYAETAAPLAVLCTASCVIAVSSIIGTALIAAGRLRPLAVQISVSLVVNVACLALLVAPLGALGAATAALLCELVGAVILVRAARVHLPGLLTFNPSRPFGVPAGAKATP